MVGLRPNEGGDKEALSSNVTHERVHDAPDGHPFENQVATPVSSDVVVPQSSLTTAHRTGGLTGSLRPPMIDRPATEGPDAPPTKPITLAATVALPDRPDSSSPWVYEIATLDVGGRFYPRDAMEHLRWLPHSHVALRMVGHRVIITKVTRRSRQAPTARKISLDARGRLCLPDAQRQWLGVSAGDRVVVATNRKAQQVVVLNSGYLDAVNGLDHAVVPRSAWRKL
jgi:hypothetical protein